MLFRMVWYESFDNESVVRGILSKLGFNGMRLFTKLVFNFNAVIVLKWAFVRAVPFYCLYLLDIAAAAQVCDATMPKLLLQLGT